MRGGAALPRLRQLLAGVHDDVVDVLDAVVEDHPVLGLRPVGAEVDHAGDGLEALDDVHRVAHEDLLCCVSQAPLPSTFDNLSTFA